MNELHRPWTSSIAFENPFLEQAAVRSTFLLISRKFRKNRNSLSVDGYEITLAVNLLVHKLLVLVDSVSLPCHELWTCGQKPRRGGGLAVNNIQKPPRDVGYRFSLATVPVEFRIKVKPNHDRPSFSLSFLRCRLCYVIIAQQGYEHWLWSTERSQATLKWSAPFLPAPT